MSPLQVAILAVVQGLAELLPVSSSAHVVVAEKLMGLDPSSPPMTLLLVMLHTGTMFAVIVYFYNRWRRTYFESAVAFKTFAWRVVLATALTGAIGEGAIKLIEKTSWLGSPHAEVEELFSHLELIAPALAIVGVLIVAADILTRRNQAQPREGDVSAKQAAVIGIAQGLSLPFRGFSRSGSTISAGMLLGTSRSRAENFSFALAVVLTPAVVGRELLRLIHSPRLDPTAIAPAVYSGLLGAVLSFAAGLAALQWLSAWLEAGRWYWFGIYCIFAAIFVAALHYSGY